MAAGNRLADLGLFRRYQPPAGCSTTVDVNRSIGQVATCSASMSHLAALFCALGEMWRAGVAAYRWIPVSFDVLTARHRARPGRGPGSSGDDIAQLMMAPLIWSQHGASILRARLRLCGGLTVVILIECALSSADFKYCNRWLWCFLSHADAPGGDTEMPQTCCNRCCWERSFATDLSAGTPPAATFCWCSAMTLNAER